jgi:formamidopyrimidine-DNA glycosylase
MPELPEMENYKRLLNQKITEQVITDVQVNREKSINVIPELFIKSVLHQKVIEVNRRGKHLLIQLQNRQVLLLHLMLGGWMYFGTEEDKPKRTIQVRLSFGQHHLYFIGLRLGYLHLYSEKDVQKPIEHLGPEPLEADFTLEKFIKMLADKRGRIKTKLLDQEFIAGIGNCYSDEICYHARILPKRNIDEIGDPERSQLYQSVKHILLDALKNGGYMDNPFYQGDTLTGGYKNLCLVYDREGQSCKRCGSTITKEMISSRKTFFCPNCQK